MSGSQSDSRHSAGSAEAARGNATREAPTEQGDGLTKPSAATSGASAAGMRVHSVPRWRQIEILRERRALREALDEFGDLDVELSDDVFGDGLDDPAWFRTPGEADEEPEGDDAADDGDTEDLDDDYSDQALD